MPAVAGTVAMYLTALADAEARRALSAPGVCMLQAHQPAGLESPTSYCGGPALLAGIRRSIGTGAARKGASDHPGNSSHGCWPSGESARRPRSRATARRVCWSLSVDRSLSDWMLLICVQPRRPDDHSQGFQRRTRSAKGRKVGIPLWLAPGNLPVRSVRAWIDASAIETGPVFPRQLTGTAACSRIGF